jgi:NAD+ kinase
LKARLFGEQADMLRDELGADAIQFVEDDPDVVICFGGDGTLLSAELAWPGVPKVPIRNSRRGIRCIPHPPGEVLECLAAGKLIPTRFMKLECAVRYKGSEEPVCWLTAMNEFNAHMGLINSAVRFKLWLNDGGYQNGHEIIGDGFVVSTPFGSTAYYNQITRGVFHKGLGVAFKATADHTDHLVVPEDSTIRAVITRGPAVLAFDNAPEYFDLDEGDELTIRKHEQEAVILTLDPIQHPCDVF